MSDKPLKLRDLLVEAIVCARSMQEARIATALAVVAERADLLDETMPDVDLLAARLKGNL